MRYTILAFVVIAKIATAQVTYLGSLGTPQTVPNPNGGAAGTIGLSGQYCANQGLHFGVRGLPLPYASTITNEAVYFALEAGQSMLPGVNILGGQFYVPLINPLLLGPQSVTYLGPGDVVLCPGLIVLPGPPITNPFYGAATGWIAIPPGTVGMLTIQGFMLDPNVNRFFTSNAINFSIP